MISDFVFLTEEELIRLDRKQHNIILWGMGTTVIPVIDTMNSLGIMFDFWGTGSSNTRIHSDGRRILTYEEMSEHTDDIVIIASFAYVPIYKRLRQMGVKRIYGIQDTFKYPYKELISDRYYLDNYFNKAETVNNGKILLELYGNIGDVIIRIGIVKAFIEKYGQDNVYLFFASIDNAEIYKCYSDNIFIMSEDIINDSISRRHVLENICKNRFEKAYVLCDSRIYAQRRVLNRYNLNVNNVIWTKCLPEQENLVSLDINTVAQELSDCNKAMLTSWNKLSGKDISHYCKCQIPDKRYVVVNLGASKKTRQYPARQFIAVCKYIISKGYEIALVGYGYDDETVAEYIQSDSHICDRLVNYVSKLTLTESAYIISQSEFFIGTDSGMWNISYAFGKPSVVIYGGGEYGNFMHPDGMIKYVTVGSMKCFNCKWFCDKTDEYGAAKCVYDITPDQIIAAIDELIQEIPLNIEY